MPKSRSHKSPQKRARIAKARRPQAIAAAVVLVSFLLVVLAGVWAYNRVVGYPDRPTSGDARAIEFTIPRGTSLPGVLELLVEHEVLASDESAMFKVFVLHEGMAGRLTAGDHAFVQSMTPREILTELLRKPAVEQFRVTIPEGKHHLQIAEIIEKAGGPPAEQFIAAVRDPNLLAQLNISAANAEGYLFPDTYVFRLGVSAKSVVQRLVARHGQVYDDLARDYRPAIMRLRREQGWNHREVVTLASIVEKETGAAEERPLIAGVFLNRLRFASFKPKLLQTDPTIIYGCTVAVVKSEACRGFEGRIRRIHLRDKENPYNTYTHVGLPPGPISNPGRAAMEAVLAPEKSRYLYFVAKNPRRHYFSKSRAEHERAVEKYIRQGVVDP